MMFSKAVHHETNNPFIYPHKKMPGKNDQQSQIFTQTFRKIDIPIFPSLTRTLPSFKLSQTSPSTDSIIISLDTFCCYKVGVYFYDTYNALRTGKSHPGG